MPALSHVRTLLLVLPLPCPATRPSHPPVAALTVSPLYQNPIRPFPLLLLFSPPPISPTITLSSSSILFPSAAPDRCSLLIAALFSTFLLLVLLPLPLQLLSSISFLHFPSASFFSPSRLRNISSHLSTLRSTSLRPPFNTIRPFTLLLLSSLPPFPSSSHSLLRLSPLLYSCSCGAAADYSAVIPPLISPLNSSAADYLIPIPPPHISPLNGSAADYLAPIPPLISPYICSIAIPSPRWGLFSFLPLFLNASALTLLLPYLLSYPCLPYSPLPSLPLPPLAPLLLAAGPPLFSTPLLGFRCPISIAALLSLIESLVLLLLWTLALSFHFLYPFKALPLTLPALRLPLFAFRDAGVLRNFPRPLSIDGAGETMTMICTGTSSLPCHAFMFPLAVITSYPSPPSNAWVCERSSPQVHSIVIFITTTGTSLVSPFLLLLASTPFVFPSPHLSITLPLLLPLPSPLATVTLSPNLPFFSIIVLATPTSLSFAAWSIRNCFMISLPLSRPFPPLPLLHAPLVFKPSSPNLLILLSLLPPPNPLILCIWTSGVPLPLPLVRVIATFSFLSITTLALPPSIPSVPNLKPPSLIIRWAEQACLCFGHRVARLHSDGGGDFFNHSLSSYCSSHGICQTSTLPHSPEENGVAERRIRTLMEITRCLLTHASAPRSRWSYTLVHATLLSNVRPHPLRPSITPFQLWTGHQPSARPLRVWGCLIRSQDVFFDETRSPFLIPPPTPPPPSLHYSDFDPLPSTAPSPSPLPPTPAPPPLLAPSTPPSAIISDTSPPASSSSAPMPSPSQHPPPLPPAPTPTPSPSPPPSATLPSAPAPPPSPHLTRFMTRAMSSFQHSTLFTRLSPSPNVDLLEDRFEELFSIHPVSSLLCVTIGDFSNSPTLLSVDTAAVPTPQTYSKAVSDFHATEWMAAIIAESHYCAKGFTQCEGIDYFATYSPTARLPTLRLLLDLGAHWDWEIHSLNVSNAFLQGELHERIFLKRPTGFPHPFPPGTVWELKRPLYGLKQAPREWHAKLASSSDLSLFIRTSPYRLYILAYVDDLVLLSEDSTDLAAV
ncbi:unnamed protein product [Closterium sp. NIES-54]